LYNDEKGDYPDNLQRFNFYCRKSLEVLKSMAFYPDVFHCNDWQTGLIPLYLRYNQEFNKTFAKSKSLITIHNLAFQGYFDAKYFIDLDLDKEALGLLSIYGRINFLKGAILSSSKINTVSPNYSRQIQTKEFGCGLEDILKNRASDITGILNAVDYKVWNPAKDKFIYSNYDGEKIYMKEENKFQLKKELALKPDDKKMLMGMVTRISEQKGIDLIIDILPGITKFCQLVIIGLGDAKYQQQLKDLSSRYPKDFVFVQDFNERLAHKIYAGSDFFLMPSRFEPCGISQLISFKYMTMPIVNNTGGLSDTVIDVDIDKENGNGIVMNGFSSKDLLRAIKRSQKIFADKKRMDLIKKRIFNLDFSWENTSKEYLNLYNNL